MYFRIFSIIGLLVTMGSPAAAATIHRAFAQSGGGCTPGYQEGDLTDNGSAATALGLAFEAGTNGCTARSRGTAWLGFLSTSASTELNQNGFSFGETSASTRTDVTITAPAGANPLDLIPVQVAFDVSASLFAHAPEGLSRQGSANADYRFDFSITGSQGPSNSTRTEGRFDWQAIDGFDYGQDNLIVSQTIISDPIYIVAAGGLNLFYSAQSNAGATKCPFCPQGNNAFSDASDTASLATSRPAFILPDGYFVNAPDLNVVNNYWIDPRDPTPSPVPLPASLPLLMLGGLALSLIGRRGSDRGVPGR